MCSVFVGSLCKGVLIDGAVALVLLHRPADLLLIRFWHPTSTLVTRVQTRPDNFLLSKLALLRRADRVCKPTLLRRLVVGGQWFVD